MHNELGIWSRQVLDHEGLPVLRGGGVYRLVLQLLPILLVLGQGAILLHLRCGLVITSVLKVSVVTVVHVHDRGILVRYGAAATLCLTFCCFWRGFHSSSVQLVITSELKGCICLNVKEGSQVRGE